MSKARVKLLNRIAVYDFDIEFMDVLNIYTKHSFKKIKLFECAVPDQHPKLSSIREPSKEYRRIKNHLKSTLYDSIIVRYYEETMLYLQEALSCAINNGLDFNRIVGSDHHDYSSKNIIAARNWAGIVKMISRDIFRKLEAKRNTTELLDELNKKLGLNVSKSKIDNVMPFLEMRHLIVHNDGKADLKFCERFPSFGFVQGRNMSVDFQTVTNAKNAIIDFINEFDSKAIGAKVFLA